MSISTISEASITRFDNARVQYNKELHDLRMKYGRIFTDIMEGVINNESTSANDNQGVTRLLQ